MKILFLFILSLAILLGCEDPTDPIDTNGNNYLPLEAGNYWIYQSYELNQQGQVIGGTQSIDSVVISDFQLYAGFKTYFFIRFRNGSILDTIRIAEQNNKIYQFLYKDMYIPDFTGDYLPIIDLTVKLNDSWNLFTKYIYPYYTEIDGINYKGTYRHTINGNYVSKDSIGIENKAYLSQSYSNKYDSKLDFSIPRKNYNTDGSYYWDTLKYNKLLKYVEWYRIVKGIGFTQIKREPYTMNISTSPSSTISEMKYFNGKESVLLRFGKVMNSEF